jgi:hypothetical protein
LGSGGISKFPVTLKVKRIKRQLRIQREPSFSKRKGETWHIIL